MRLYYLYILFSFALMGCNLNHQKSSPSKTHNATISDSENLAAYKHYVDSITTNWRMRLLKITHEPDLRYVKNEQYRLLSIMGASPHIHHIYRIEGDSNRNYLLTVKTFKVKAPDGEGHDTLLNTKKIQITESDWTEFKTLIDGSYFWNLNNPEGERNEFISWTLEGHRKILNPPANSLEMMKAAYHVVTTGDVRKSSLNEACNYLISLADSVKTTKVHP